MKIGIVIGSIRQGRVSDRLAKWVEKDIKKLDGVQTKMIDLIDYPMPLFDEPVSPQYNPQRKPVKEVQKWLDVVSDLDALILVTPEYNRSYSAVLKNALDYLDFQLKRKPVMLVAHGSTGGAQAVAHLRGVIPGLGAITTPLAVMVVGRIDQLIDEKGNLDAEIKANPYGPQGALGLGLAELIWFTQTLSKS
jgi:NAD(P)H-dependent FMN reductase